jgi:hypothetical protein
VAHLGLAISILGLFDRLGHKAILIHLPLNEVFIYKCEKPSVTCSSRKTSPKLSKTLTASSGLVGNENTRDHRSQSTSSPVAPLAEAVCESEQGRRSTTKAQSRIMTPISIQEFIAKYSHVLYFASTT